MLNRGTLVVSTLGFFVLAAAGEVLAQAPTSRAAASQAAPAVPAAPPPPPATKLEAFKPAAGSLLLFGYDNLGSVAAGNVSVDVRELREQKGAGARGVAVEVSESQYREERAFIDSDELSELIKGIDALLEVKTNPTQFQSFEARYTTRGELMLIAFSSRNSISFAVQAGRITKARAFVSLGDMQKLRGIFEAASQKLATLAPTK